MSVLKTAWWFVEAQAWNVFTCIKEKLFLRKEAKTEWKSPCTILTREDVLSLVQAYRNTTSPMKMMADKFRGVPCNPIVGVLKVPRSFGDKGEEQAVIMEKLKADSNMVYTLALAGVVHNDADLMQRAEEHLLIWAESCTHPEDGGEGTDALIGRAAGDTPIAICEHFTNFVYAYDLLKGNWLIGSASANTIEAWIKKFAYYVRDYDPAQLNNHLAWKALFCLASANAIKDDTLWRDGIRYCRKAMTQIKPDGTMPLELARGKLASSYTKMALEAFFHCGLICQNNGYPDILQSDRLKAALKDFELCVTNNSEWVKKHFDLILSNDQRLPDDIKKWSWVFVIPNEKISGYTFFFENKTLRTADYIPEGAYVSSWLTYIL